MKTYLAAAIQMNSQPDSESNFQQAAHLINAAVNKGAKLVGLPEYFPFLGGLSEKVKRSAELAKQSEVFLHETAKKHGIYLLGGTIPVPAEDDGGKIYNRSLLFGPDGKLIASYDKIHLFDVELPGGETYRESDQIKPGPVKAKVAETGEIGNIGMSVCYDVRFPELYRSMMDFPADLMTVPSAFTATTGKAHWEPLLRARAIENSSYVFAPAQTGTHGRNRTTHGHAMIISPWGEILADAGTETGFAIAEIDLDYLAGIRQKLPSLKHRVL